MYFCGNTSHEQKWVIIKTDDLKKKKKNKLLRKSLLVSVYIFLSRAANNNLMLSAYKRNFWLTLTQTVNSAKIAAHFIIT